MSNDLSLLVRKRSRSLSSELEKLYHVIYFDHVSWNDGDELTEPTCDVEKEMNGKRKGGVDGEREGANRLY